MEKHQEICLDIRSEYQYIESMLRRQNSCWGLPKIFVEIHLKRLPLQFEGIQMNLIEENIDLLRTDLIFFFLLLSWRPGRAISSDLKYSNRRGFH